MLSRYPHSIKFTKTETEGEPQQDVHGNWLPQTVTTAEITQKCRAELKGSGSKVTLEDGTTVEFSYLVYLHRRAIPIEYDTPVILTTFDPKPYNGTAKKFVVEGMHCMLWV